MFLYPKLDHIIRLREVLVGIIEAFDKEMREIVKNINNLSAEASSETLHSPVRVGGLGLRCLKIKTKLMDTRRLLLACNSSDINLKHMTCHKAINAKTSGAKNNNQTWHSRFYLKMTNIMYKKILLLPHKYAEKFKIELAEPQTGVVTVMRFSVNKDFEAHSLPQVSVRELRSFVTYNSLEKWSQQEIQGSVIKQITRNPDQCVNLISDKVPIFISSWCLKALLDILPTRNSLIIRNISHRLKGLSCRICGVEGESLKHTVNTCIHTKTLQTMRHNKIIDKVLQSSKLPESAVIKNNQTYPWESNLRPGILILNKAGYKDYIIDVTIAFEDPKNMKKVAKNKFDKYSLL